MTERCSRGRSEPTLCLVDGTALAYRSHYAFIRRPLTNSRGENVSAIYGFADALLRMLDELDPDYVVVAFDTPEPTFRHEAYEDYKATREEAPDDMVEQLPAIQDFVAALSVGIVEVPGYEADDLIGTLAVRARKASVRAVIVSGDKDFFQLVGDGVTVLDPHKKLEYTPEGVKEKFGVPPDRVIEVLGLMGDASDNVPGVPGIGKKTATTLITEYGTIEEVLAHVDEISGQKRRQNLREYADEAFASRSLVTIDTEAPVGVTLDDLARVPPDVDRITAFLREHELPSLLDRVLPLASERSAGYEIVTTKKALKALASKLKSSDGFVIDLETTSLDAISADIVGLAVAADEDGAFYVPVGHASGKNLPLDHVLEVMRPLLEDPGLPKIGHNLKYDYKVLAAHGVEMAPLSFDTMIASYLLDPGRRQHGLAALALEHLNRRMTPIEDLIGKGREQLTFDQVSTGDALDYACADAEVTFRLASLLGSSVQDEGLEDLMSGIEMPLVRVLARMELRGVAVDAGVLDELNDEFCGDADALRERIFEACGVEFNVDSPKQVGEALFQRLGLPRGRRTKTGYSTDTNVLERLRGVHEAPGLILSYRQLMKLRSGYLDALPRLVNERTGRVHTSFNQTVTSTGRLSSSNPNLQNIPARTDMGRRIRRAFVSEKGRVLVSADYSQIELRIMAHLSRDERLMEAFHAGEDFHRSTAAAILERDEEDITAAERDWAKTINFGIMYGMSPFGLARQLEIDSGEAAEFIDRYFETYPRVREYTDRVVAQARETGYAVTILGRRRPISGLSSDNANVRGMAERAAVNTPIQGSAADLIKVAMLGVEARIARERLPADMILQVHDELVFEVDAGAAAELGEAVRDEMEHPSGVELSVPIVVNLGSGSNWLEAH